jgi:hypothetical protein
MKIPISSLIPDPDMFYSIYLINQEIIKALGDIRLG